MGVGDDVAVDSPTGSVPLSIAAIVAGFRATIMVDRPVFTERWDDDRIDVLYVTLAPGADPQAVRQAIRSRLGETPALIATRQEVTDDWRRALGSIDTSMAAVLVSRARRLDPGECDGARGLGGGAGA